MSATAPGATAQSRWAGAWPDALAFAGGLALAWGAGWQTGDLVWSLWLSSLTVGYALIVWGAFTPAAVAVREGRAGRAVGATLAGCAALAFFTVHFGLFHLAHGHFLGMFFPPVPGREFPDWQVFWEVVRRYGWWVPLALLAERRAFRLGPVPPEPPATSVKAADIAARKERQTIGSSMLFRPYLNVVRLHVLIFFFAAAHAVRLGGFPVYAVVYAAYFFPWRLLRREGSGVA